MHLRRGLVLGLCLCVTSGLLACGDDDHHGPTLDGSMGDGSDDGATRDADTDAQLDAGQDASDQDAAIDAAIDGSLEDAAVTAPPRKGSETAMDSELGRSLAIDGDTIVIGAPGEAGGGGAYVFVLSGGIWLEQAHLHASNRDPNDRFGTSVAIDGDSIVVGAVGESSNATGVDGDGSDNSRRGSGAAYLFTRDTGVWTEQAYLKASNTDGNDNFGYSVAIDGDTIAVSAHTEASPATGVNGPQGNDGNTSFSGAVYVFVNDGGVWSQQAYIKASNTGQFDRFGVSIDLDGDTLAVGAYYEDSQAGGINGDQANEAAPEAGAVYVLTRDIDTWTQQAYIKASNVGAGDHFGGSVALEGDVLVVGAHDESGLADDPVSDIATSSGAAYVFMRTGFTWRETDYLKPSVSDVGDVFGTMVAIHNGVIAVGAKDEDSAGRHPNADPLDDSAIDSGAAYLFEDMGDGYVQTRYIKAGNTGEGDKFGTALGLNDTLLIVGAFSERGTSDNSPNEGAFYIYDL